MAVARDTFAGFSLTQTPQTQPVPGRADQVRNNAGGYVFAKDLFAKVEDFLVLGTTAGTYHVGQDKLNAQNIDWLLDAIKQDGVRVVDLIVDVSASRPPRAPKNRPAVFALAVVFGAGDPAAVQAAKAAFPKVVRTTFDFAMFHGYCKQARGKPAAVGTTLRAGRALRTAYGSWFFPPQDHLPAAGAVDPEEHPGDPVLRATAWKVCKARQRKTPAGERFALQDALRIAHSPRGAQLGPNAAARRALLGWVAGTVTDEQARELVPTVDDFLTAQAVTTEAEAVRVVTVRGVPWEFLPSQHLKSKAVWEALASTVGMTALIRNLAHMTRLGVLAPFAATNAEVVRRLTSADALNKARVHPMDVFLALRVYNSGRSQPDLKAPVETWAPVPGISDALEEAYDLSFGHVAPSGRTWILAVDSSGSMGHWSRVTMGGSPLGTAYEVACSMAVMLKRIEGENLHVIDVDTDVHPSRVTARSNLREIASWMPSGGGTDLALPFTYAWRQGLQVDGFAVLTDGETWAGGRHPFQALKIYRDNFNPAARVVVAAMCAVGHSIMEPGDPGVLNVAGVDASLPKVVTEFFRS